MHELKQFPNLAAFRTSVLDLLMQAWSSDRRANVHLLYVPGEDDPLRQTQGSGRARASVGRSRQSAAANATGSTLGLVTLDSAHARAFERSSGDVPALDDPLLEASIALAHSELDRPAPAAYLDIDDDERARCSVCGWLVTTEDAGVAAARLGHAMLQIHTPGTAMAKYPKRVLSRWFDPVHFESLWQVLSAAQRRSLTGGAVWVTPDGAGRAVRYDAPPMPAPFFARPVDDGHARRIRNVALVDDLAQAWAAMREEQRLPLPADATVVLHEHVAAAQELGLDADSVSIYALTAVQMRVGATDDAAWCRLARHSAEHRELLRDLLPSLPAPFWSEWSGATNDERETR